MGKTKNINDYLISLNEQLKTVDLVEDDFYKKLLLNDFERKLNHISNEFTLKDADMKLVLELSIGIKQRFNKLTKQVITK